MCEHSMWALYVWALYMWALYVWALYVSTLCVSTLYMCDHSMWALYVWPLYVSTLCVTPPQKHQKNHDSSWAGCCRTPTITKITRKNEHQFLGRMLQRQKRQKSTSFIVKTPFKTIAEHRKVRELPRKMNMEEVEEPKKVRKFTDETRFRPFQEHRRTPKSTRITTKNEHRRSCEAGNYENLQTKPVHAGLRPPRKLRKFTDETNMQARNPENSDEIRPTPVRHLDLATPAFYHYRKNPKCYHTVWGKRIISLPLEDLDQYEYSVREMGTTFFHSWESWITLKIPALMRFCRAMVWYLQRALDICSRS